MSKGQPEEKNLPAENWQTENDFDTLMRGEEIRSDPDRHKAAIAHGRKKMKHISKITSLNSLRNVARSKRYDKDGNAYDSRDDDDTEDEA